MKTVLILGGTSDIGVAIARYFAGENFDIALAGRNVAELEKLATDIQIRSGRETRAILFDALDFDSHKKTYQSLGFIPDVCVCAFGYLGDQPTAASHWSEAKKIIDSNYTGAVSILNIVAEDFAKRGSGTIIGISSVAGDRGRQSNYIYGSAKAAFTAYLSGLRNHLFHSGVEVMTVKPGFVASKMTEGLALPPKLTAQPGQVGRQVYDAYLKKQNVVYVLGIWRYIMGTIGLLPEFAFKRMKL
jgi:decaprenylphospho-beta-D-erythro-pentofuranosid-2-ulose 2-reductase